MWNWPLDKIHPRPWKYLFHDKEALRQTNHYRVWRRGKNALWAAGRALALPRNPEGPILSCLSSGFNPFRLTRWAMAALLLRDLLPMNKKSFATRWVLTLATFWLHADIGAKHLVLSGPSIGNLLANGIRSLSDPRPRRGILIRSCGSFSWECKGIVS